VLQGEVFMDQNHGVQNLGQPEECFLFAPGKIKISGVLRTQFLIGKKIYFLSSQ
jgi:hypothetical protein